MPSLSEADRRSLLELARRTIAKAVCLQKSAESIPQSEAFAEKRGVFVTIHARGRLRGCIGVVEAFEPLGEAVARCAADAALHDPRFSPVRADEIQDLQIEISLLSRPEPILTENIEIGKHGLLISKARSAGFYCRRLRLSINLASNSFWKRPAAKQV
jgi:AmmeMemoRadiSam system protein A